MRTLTLLLLFLFISLQGCTNKKEQITESELASREITEAPELNISTAIETGERRLTWTTVANASVYIVQRDVTYGFSSPELYYTGPNNSVSLYPSPDGLIRYYRVVAQNQSYSGPWSRIINDQ